jgi:trehalose 6-phosphate phosphatase
MVTATCTIPGALIEDNIYSISVHYRNCSPADMQLIDDITTREFESFRSSLVRRSGKCVYEIRPLMDWNKGCAVEWLLKTIFNDTSNVVPMYLGDDITGNKTDGHKHAEN